MNARLASATLALALLAGCATPPKGPPNIPTRVKTGQSWVITRQALAAQVLDPCSRDSPARHPGEVTGYWAPSRQQLERLEADQSRLQPTIAAPADFDRQYVGIEAHGRRLIYINAFRLPDDSELDPGRSAVDVCDGGAGTWGAVYDPESGQFSDIAVGGTR